MVDLKYRDEKIVLFEEFAKKFLSENLTFAIELKTIGIEKQTLEIIDKYSKSKENIYITSFIFEALENVRKLDKDIKISWLIDEEIMQKVYKLNIEGMTVNFPDKLKVLIEEE